MLNNPAKVCAGITRQDLFGNLLFVFSDLRPEDTNVRRLLFSTLQAVIVDLLPLSSTATLNIIVDRDVKHYCRPRR
jgi:hypothetical protein